jgi:glutamine synthetase
LERPDLHLAGRTVFGAKSPKGQELEDHYFATPKARVLSFMKAFEETASTLGIPLKTRHNEVAPAQYETAPLFEKSTAAVDHNLLLMELMRQIAAEQHLACLFHEKPFKGVNGSGKHNNWSMATDTGLNFLDPEGDRFLFLTVLTAILKGVHDHAALLRASIASAGNDYRLGGSEAPPTILSVDLGVLLESLVDAVISGSKEEIHPKLFDTQLPFFSRFAVDPSDRNRTSFFAFTGNKFEFRAVGASAHCAFPISVINAVVADSLQLLIDEIKDQVKDGKRKGEDLLQIALPILKKHLKAARPIVFGGNGYSAEWEEEAKQRGLPNIRKSVEAFSHLLDKKTIRVFQGILSEAELHSRHEIFVEQYVKQMQIELNLMVDLFQTELLPAAEKDMRARGRTEPLIDEAIHACNEVKKLAGQMKEFGWEAKAKVFAELLSQKMEEFRSTVDALEQVVDHALWPLPKYRELLFSL